jgi:hypothetical protein
VPGSALIQLPTVLLLAAVVVGCGSGSTATTDVRAGARPIACDIGGRPDYFVPGGPKAVIIGCLRLLSSGRTVEFTADSEHIARGRYVCLNPAYPARGRRRGSYIPNVCVKRAHSRRFGVINAKVPPQGVEGYSLVLWGTGPAGLDRIGVQFRRGRTRAEVLDVDRSIATEIGLRKPFSVFVAELPKDSACDEIVIEVDGRRADRIRSRSEPCRKTVCDALITALAGPGPHPIPKALCALPKGR